MKKRIQPWFAVVLVLMAIGLASRLMQGSVQSWLIPVTLIVIVYVLYKFPPNRWNKGRPKLRQRDKGPRPDFRRSGPKSDRKNTPTFTVIEGRKNKEDEPPKYH